MKNGRTSSRASCIACNAVAALYLSPLYSKEAMVAAARSVCISFRLQSPRVCRGLVDSFKVCSTSLFLSLFLSFLLPALYLPSYQYLCHFPLRVKELFLPFSFIRLFHILPISLSLSLPWIQFFLNQNSSWQRYFREGRGNSSQEEMMYENPF